VRLKAGDPFVLGRGGEEALALLAAGVPFEVVPGLSSALAAPALGGIPLTHRGLASAFLVMSGHDDAAWRPLVGGLAPGSATLVVLMGLHARARLAAALLERGWPEATPAAVLLAAGTAGAGGWRGCLSELAAAPEPIAAGERPGVIVVGVVVELAAALSGLGLEEAWKPHSHTARSAARG
jgi:uroporphyrin-III C-methyltransferase/precorrin-2 dehydrogenase/sirohydrochlorin ferrochelatase